MEEGYFHNSEKTQRDSMTLKDYFDYCKIAYIAAQEKKYPIDSTLTGREMYERYADGRDNGLLQINENSPKEFADWIDGKHAKKTTGGHPWEIKRGGNTTHIDLYVSRPSFQKDKFEITLCGRSIRRLHETINMFLAIYDANLPITINDPEGIRRRLLGQDNIGIIANHDSLHRANQHFDEELHVYDVMYLDDFRHSNRSVLPFITWEPLPILQPIIK